MPMAAGEGGEGEEGTFAATRRRAKRGGSGRDSKRGRKDDHEEDHQRRGITGEPDAGRNLPPRPPSRAREPRRVGWTLGAKQSLPAQTHYSAASRSRFAARPLALASFIAGPWSARSDFTSSSFR